jgi:hypothetical protein
MAQRFGARSQADALGRSSALELLRRRERGREQRQAQ